MSQNEITVEGMKYVATPCQSCDGCAFGGDDAQCNAATAIAPCGSAQRSDNRSVIWLTPLKAAVHRLKGTL